MDAILILNAGSSSLKFQVFGAADIGSPRRLIKGQMDGIGARPRLRTVGESNRQLIDKTYTADEIPDLRHATMAAGEWLRQVSTLSIIAAGHRVVHGGPEYDRPVMVDGEVLSRLERYVPLAPLHQPNNLAPIRALAEHAPQVPQVACFDTAFHRGHTPVADHYAIPEWLYREGVRRYGFHGLSYEYIAGRLQEVAPDIASKRVIVAHLGSGASMCALSQGHSVETTMGFTALDGLPMGTRPGQMDPGVVLYLMAQKGMAPAALQDFLYRECGLKGLSGISNDVRELVESGSASAALALDHFVYRVGLHSGMLAAALGGMDAFVFTAGIGENSAVLRARIVEKIAWLGATLDPGANEAGSLLISVRGARVPVYVVPTDEELMIARHTFSLLAGAAKPVR